MKSHCSDCYLSKRMKWEVTWENLGIASLQAGTAFWGKQDKVDRKGQCTLPVTLKTDAECSACV